MKDDQILAETIVPCRYIVNHDWPAEIKAIFDPKESSLKLGKYIRTLNRSEINATVDLIDKTVHFISSSFSSLFSIKTLTFYLFIHLSN